MAGGGARRGLTGVVAQARGRGPGSPVEAVRSFGPSPGEQKAAPGVSLARERFGVLRPPSSGAPPSGTLRFSLRIPFARRIRGVDRALPPGRRVPHGEYEPERKGDREPSAKRLLKKQGALRNYFELSRPDVGPSDRRIAKSSEGVTTGIGESLK